MADNVISKPIISSDSHVMEPPDTYIARIDKKYKDIAPKVVWQEKGGDTYVIDGMKQTIPMGLVAAAGVPAEGLATSAKFAKFADLHRGGWDPEARMADQDRDGVAAEVIYPSVGMILCNHPDPDYKKACFDAYNLWIADFCAPHPDRLLGLGQTAMRTPEEGIEDLRKMKAMGLRGVMMPGFPVMEDYDSKIYDDFFEAAISLEMPLSFHILTSREGIVAPNRGPRMNSFMSIIRANQDIMGMFVLGGVFERHPKLKIACVEADAGWVPHFMYRLDHAYDRHRYWLDVAKLSKWPSEYFREHIYMTFQDDWVAFQAKEMLNPKRLMWANDFPHSDSTWPNSQSLLKKHAQNLTAQEKDWIMHDNVAEFYGIAA
ncbi:MAG TPA: amidohydrolase family protein [Candidatus Binataceae bacterium]|nr:amidohydrolase family protein [Candidatus Binataceae bacterium]